MESGGKGGWEAEKQGFPPCFKPVTKLVEKWRPPFPRSPLWRATGEKVNNRCRNRPVIRIVSARWKTLWKLWKVEMVERLSIAGNPASGGKDYTESNPYYRSRMFLMMSSTVSLKRLSCFMFFSTCWMA